HLATRKPPIRSSKKRSPRACLGHIAGNWSLVVIIPIPMTPLDIQEILSLLPHRYPMLMVDRVVEITDESIVGIKNISFNEPQFNGHFPGLPIMPGVLIIEAMAQVAGLLVGK